MINEILLTWLQLLIFLSLTLFSDASYNRVNCYPCPGVTEKNHTFEGLKAIAKQINIIVF